MSPRSEIVAVALPAALALLGSFTSPESGRAPEDEPGRAAVRVRHSATGTWTPANRAGMERQWPTFQVTSQ